MPPATVATVATQATNARVGAHAPACAGVCAGSAPHARYRGARTREQPRLSDPHPWGDGSSQRAKTRDRGAAQFMRMK